MVQQAVQSPNLQQNKNSSFRKSFIKMSPYLHQRTSLLPISTLRSTPPKRGTSLKKPSSRILTKIKRNWAKGQLGSKKFKNMNKSINLHLLAIIIYSQNLISPFLKSVNLFSFYLKIAGSSATLTTQFMSDLNFQVPDRTILR